MLMLILLTLLVLGQLTVGSLLLLESQRTKRIDQRIFAVLCFVLIGWTISVGLLTGVDLEGASKYEAYYSLANQVAFSLSCAVVLLIYLFSQFYPVRRKMSIISRIILFFGAALVLLAPIPLFSGHFIVTGSMLTYKYGMFAIFVPLYALIALLSIYIQEGNTLRRARDHKLHKQTKTLLTGITFTIVQVVIFVIVLPGIFGQNPLFYAIGYAAPYQIILFTGYGLLKQGLFDIRAIVVRSLTYVFSILIAATLYVAPVVLFSTYILDAPLTTGSLAVLVVVTLIVAFLFEPLKQYFNRVTNRFFYRDYYDPRDVLDQVSALLVQVVDAGEVMRQSSQILGNNLKLSSINFRLYADVSKNEGRLLHQLAELDIPLIATDELDHLHHSSLKDLLNKQDVALAVRLKTTHEDIGYMFVGMKKSGDGFSKDDRKLLGVVADELAIGIQNTLRYREIQTFNATLQEKIEDATKRLRDSNAKLKALDQTKDDFISMASHQLRTPLTSVKGYVSMVLDGDVGEITPTQRKLLNQAFVSSQRMVYLISDLLNVSRLRTGKFLIEPVPTNLANVIEDEVAQLQETSAGRNLQLKYSKPEHFPALMLDETKIRQVIMNFMDNAIYYTPSGGEIHVNLVEKPMSVEFTVVDNGIGVPKHEQHHLFSKFYRAHNAKRARPDGTGLGLFMAKKVIVAQGGAIIFRSQEKKGSTFGFIMPKEKLLSEKSHDQ